MRILKILNSHDGGGVRQCETQYLSFLRQKEVTVDVVIIGDGDQGRHYKSLSNSHIDLPNLTKDYRGSLKERLSSLYLTYLYAKNNVKRVTSHFSDDYDAVIYRRPNFMFLAGMIAKQKKIPGFWHLPGIVSNPFSRKLYSIICNRYGIIPIANSKFTQSTLGARKSYYVYPGFDPERVEPKGETFRSELGIPADAPVYGMAARVCEEKAQDLLVSGFLESEAIAENAHLLIAGDINENPFAKKVKSIADTKLDENIHFLGRITDLNKFYSTVDVVVNARRNAEAFGISVAEGMGAGKPIIAYHLGGPSEMVENEQNGWLIHGTTPHHYREKLNLSLQMRDEWHAMGLKSKNKATKLTVAYNVNKLSDIIKKENRI